MEELVSSLKVGKTKGAEGPNGLTPQFLKNLGEVSRSFKLDTFNKSWREGVCPQSWRDAVIVPILKPGKPEGQIDSYRPIALTSCLAKVMEHMVAKRLQHLAESCGMLNSDQSGFRPQRSTEDQAISDGFQAKKPPNRTVLALLDFSKAYDKVWRADILAKMLRKGIPVRYVRWIQGFLSNRQARIHLDRTYSRPWVLEGVPQGSVLALLLFLFVIDDLQDCLPRGVHSSLFAVDSALWVHSPKEDAVPVLQEGMRKVYQWARMKKLTLNLKKCEVSFFSADPHEARWQPVVEVKGTKLAFNPNPLFLSMELGRTLSGKEQADRKAANLAKGSWMLTALSGSDWGWFSDLLRKV
jgi:hypothetical protein